MRGVKPLAALLTIVAGMSTGPALALEDTVRAPEPPAVESGEFLVELPALPRSAGGLAELRRPLGERWILVRSGLSGSPEQVARRLSEALRTHVEPNYVLRGQLSPEDEPEFFRQWFLHNVGQEVAPSIGVGTPGADVDAPTAWKATTGAPDVVVAVLDSGLDFDHPEFAGTLWTNTGEIPGNNVDDDANGYVDDVRGWDVVDGDPLPAAVDGHGTSVAGIVSAGVDGAGIAGLAPTSRLMVVRVCRTVASCTVADVVEGLSYATAFADVINLSIGGAVESRALADAVASAAAADALLVAAAGNSSADMDTTPFYPASYAEVAAVGATDFDDGLADFSNRGVLSVDVLAPGVDMWTTDLVVEGGYGFISGTSFSAPLVAAAGALARSLDRCRTAEEIRDTIVETARPVAPLVRSSRSGGVLDAGSTVRRTLATRIPFRIDRTFGSVPLDVAAQGCLPGATVWRFGDGSTIAGRVASHRYGSAGIFELRYQVDGAVAATSEVVVGVPFVDTEGSVFADDITWLSAAHITKGCNPPANDRYCPHDTLTRGEMAAFLARALHLTDRAATFTDIADSTFRTDIEKLAAAGITKGCNPPANDRYCPHDTLTRGEMAAFLRRALG